MHMGLAPFCQSADVFSPASWQILGCMPRYWGTHRSSPLSEESPVWYCRPWTQQDTCNRGPLGAWDFERTNAGCLSSVLGCWTSWSVSHHKLKLLPTARWLALMWCDLSRVIYLDFSSDRKFHMVWFYFIFFNLPGWPAEGHFKAYAFSAFHF